MLQNSHISTNLTRLTGKAMDNIRSIQEVQSSRFSAGHGSSHEWRLPHYGGYTFAGIPGTVMAALGIPCNQAQLPVDVLPHGLKIYDKVVVILVDGFGFHSLVHYTTVDPLPDLVAIREAGVTSMITSQFPSTTAAHVTTIHSGLPVEVTGVYEWFYYESALGALIAPLPFSFVGDGESETMKRAGIAGDDFLPRSSFYQTIVDNRLAAVAIQDERFAFSSYNSSLLKAAETRGVATDRAGFDALSDCLTVDDRRGYYFLYLGEFDSVGHRHGTLSTEGRAAAEAIFAGIKRSVLDLKGTQKGKTLVMITADHGQVGIDPKHTHYLDRELPWLDARLERTVDGRIKTPAGSSRDYFLHVKPELVGDTVERIRAHLQGVADVVTTEDAVRGGLFPDMGDRLRANLGNVIIIPYAGESVYWAGERGQFVKDFVSHHGGLEPIEMESILLSFEL